MLGPGWADAVALLAACLLAVTATPAGVSGAVLLLPFQLSVLGTPSPAVTPTNLLCNVIATPGAIYRYRRQGQTGGRLAVSMIAGTLPGVIAGSVIRVELRPGQRTFDLVVAAILIPLGIWPALTRPPMQASRIRSSPLAGGWQHRSSSRWRPSWDASAATESAAARSWLRSSSDPHRHRPPRLRGGFRL